MLFEVDGGTAELLGDADRLGGWLLLVERVRQSYVDLDDPTYLEFDYVRAIAAVLAGLRPGPLDVVHVGGGGLTLARWVAAVRPGSVQVVLEPDGRLTDEVRRRLPYPTGLDVRCRAVAGRPGLAGLPDGSADAVVVDAFDDGHVPADLTTVECAAEVARVLRPGGLLLANLVDGGDLAYVGRVAASVATALPHLALEAGDGVLAGTHDGNVLLVAADPLPDAAAPAPGRGRIGAGRLAALLAGAEVLTDAAPLRSPAGVHRMDAGIPSDPQRA